jgi:hypothetical protein
MSWPKEVLGVKLPIWFSTTKSWELSWFFCVQEMCHIPLESSQWGIKLCFRPNFNWRFTRKIMGPQSCGSPNLKDFGTPTWGFRDKMTFWVLAPWPDTKNIIRGKVMALASPKSRPWWILWVYVCMWFVYSLKVFQLCINQRCLVFARSCE